MELVIILFSVGLVVLVVWMSASGRLFGGGSSPTGLTAMHDMLPRDKQEAIEIMIEEKAGKRWEEQESGEGDKEVKSAECRVKSEE
jgi:hypothetical protein